MNLYQQTSKRLDVFLSREQRLVYTLCREVISDVVLAQRTQLALDVVQGILAELQEKGLVEQIAGSPLEQNPQRAWAVWVRAWRVRRPMRWPRLRLRQQFSGIPAKPQRTPSA